MVAGTMEIKPFLDSKLVRRCVLTAVERPGSPARGLFPGGAGRGAAVVQAELTTRPRQSLESRERRTRTMITKVLFLA
jgi:hypothetical protein